MKPAMKTISTALAAGAIATGAFLAGSGVNKVSKENEELRTELLEKNCKIDSLKQDVVEIKKQKAEIEFKNEFDSINKYNENLGTDFYERIINNAALIDKHNGQYDKMNKIIDKIPEEEWLNIHDVSKGRKEASQNVLEYYKKVPDKIEE